MSTGSYCALCGRYAAPLEHGCKCDDPLIVADDRELRPAYLKRFKELRARAEQAEAALVKLADSADALIERVRAAEAKLAAVLAVGERPDYVVASQPYSGLPHSVAYNAGVAACQAAAKDAP